MTKFGYWLVLVFFGVSGVIALGHGVALMAGWVEPPAEQLAKAPGDPEAFKLGVGVGSILGGLISMLVAWGIFAWKRWARIVAIILCLLNLVGFALASFQVRLKPDAVISAVIVVAALLWLFSSGTKAAFAAGGESA